MVTTDLAALALARGMTTRDITAHLQEMHDGDVSPDLISRVTDGVLEELTEWQSRPLDAVYPVVFIDALIVKIRDGVVANRPACLAIGIDLGPDPNPMTTATITYTGGRTLPQPLRKVTVSLSGARSMRA